MTARRVRTHAVPTAAALVALAGVTLGATAACAGQDLPGGLAASTWRLVEVELPSGRTDVRSAAAELTIRGDQARWRDGVNWCDGSARAAGAGIRLEPTTCSAAGYAGPSDSPVGRAQRGFDDLTQADPVRVQVTGDRLTLTAKDTTLRFER